MTTQHDWDDFWYNEDTQDKPIGENNPMKHEEYNIILQQVENIKNLCGGKSSFFSTVNSGNKRTRKIVIEYDEQEQP